MPLRTESNDEPAKGVRRWLISCDESGVHGSRFYAFGSLWMAWQRRGDFARLIADLRDRHDYRWEIKWTHVKSGSIEFYTDLVEEFFRAPWLQFHCILVEKSIVRKELHSSYDEARQKHFTLLLTNKIRRALSAHPGIRQTFRVWVDPLHSSYPKAAEVVELVSNHMLRATSGRVACVDGVYPHRSHDTPSIQLADVLLGAVWAAFEGDTAAEAKLDLQTWIAWHLGWSDLKADTHVAEKKFNVWVFYDPVRQTHRTRSRDVVLRYPQPATR